MNEASRENVTPCGGCSTAHRRVFGEPTWTERLWAQIWGPDCQRVDSSGIQ